MNLNISETGAEAGLVQFAHFLHFTYFTSDKSECIPEIIVALYFKTSFHMALSYITNPNVIINYENTTVLSTEEILSAINFANDALRSLNEQFDINIFETLGMRNLSGLVGEYFARSVQRISQGRLQSNLHQDGYPDLLLTDTPIKKKYFDSLYTVKAGKKYPKDKESFSPYKYGGLEVKATCGSTPSATTVPKPLIGEQRIELLNSFL